MSNAFMNTVFEGSMSELLGTVSTLQILLHNNLVNVPVPPNTQVFNRYLLTIVTFDFFDTEEVVLKVLDLDKGEPFSK